MIKLRPLKSNEELQRLIELAQKDGHTVLGATHLLIKNDEIVGYMSLGGLTHVHNWFDTDQCSSRDSLNAIAQAEAIMASQGIQNYIVACGNTSPFYGLMEKMGFNPVFETQLYSKEV